MAAVLEDRLAPEPPASEKQQVSTANTFRNDCKIIMGHFIREPQILKFATTANCNPGQRIDVVRAMRSIARKR